MLFIRDIVNILKLTRSPKPEYEYGANGLIVIRPVLLERLEWWSKAPWIVDDQGHKSQTAPTFVQRSFFRAMVQAWLRAARRERIVAKRTWRKERAALTRTADEATPSAQPRARKRL